MSDPKNISPLLDGFTLGVPISEQHGVVCCPAIKENSNKKYIVKVISVPSSQSQFDAMLLAGAYKDPGDAMEYFREKGEALLKEAELLKTLSKIEGFLPYDGWQMEPITRRRLGYEVYLVGSYKRSLEKYIQKNPFTHLEAVNLGLDLCSALSVCRQSGYLYVDLKPSNIYVSEKKEYRIGDLGFLNLNALRYASLPERYYSPYTPPELMDPMASMNLTVDTYAVGMILYRLYNDGNLPFTGIAPVEILPGPCHADYEMAEIILKAIHPDPEQRWTDPKDLGKAIASYMQRNGVNDIPITPFIPLDVKPEDIVVLSSEKEEETFTEDSTEFPSGECDSSEESENVNATSETQQETAPSEESENIIQEEVFADEEDPLPEAAEMISSETEEIPLVVDESASPVTEQPEQVEQTEEDNNPPYPQISEDVARIISRADDIIAHEIPEETVFPVEEQPDPFAFAKEDSDEPEDDLSEDPLMEEDQSEAIVPKQKKIKSFENQNRKKKIRKFFSRLLTLVFFVFVCIAGFWYYRHVFLQTIDSMTIHGTQDQITVLIDTGIEESLLHVYCIDENGKRKTETVQGGMVTFSDLKPSTQYIIQLDMSGFHKLTGETSEVFTTDAPTQILSFEAIAGSEDGSVMLNFTVDGDEPDFWNIRYTADGEDEKTETITNHSAMITGLTVGKLYTFTLDGGKNFDLGGETSIEYMASRLILAEDIYMTSEDGTQITIYWNTPGDVVVESWNIRFYDGYGFEEQVTVNDNQVLFTGIDPASHYTAEITAAGMTQPSRIDISSDSIFLSDFKADKISDTELKITWEYSGSEPEDGWLLMYTMDGSGSQVVTCDKAEAVLSPLIPGAKYDFTLQTADNRTVFNSVTEYQAEDAAPFKANAFVPENVTMNLLKTPEDLSWSFETISEDAFTDTFSTGDLASIVLRSASNLYHPGSKTKVLFVFRDSYGNVLPEYISEQTLVWKNIWSAGDKKNGELDIPVLPSVPGKYFMELYFDGCFVAHFDITITD